MDDFLDNYRTKVSSCSDTGLNGQCRIRIGARSSNNKHGVVYYKHSLKNNLVAELALH